MANYSGICRAFFFIDPVGEFELGCTLSGYYEAMTFFDPEEGEEEYGEIFLINSDDFTKEELVIIDKYIVDNEDSIYKKLKENYTEDDNY